MTAPRAYVVGYLEDVEVGREIAEYIERIEATMTPYGGRFLVHGGRLVGHEGTWDGDIVMLEFPDLASAQEWYESPDYQAILPLRTEHSTSRVALVEGVPDGHRAVDKIPQLFSPQDAPARPQRGLAFLSQAAGHGRDLRRLPTLPGAKAPSA